MRVMMNDGRREVKRRGGRDVEQRVRKVER